MNNCTVVKGPSIKYVTLEGEGVREGVAVCDRGESHLKKIHAYEI